MRENAMKDRFFRALCSVQAKQEEGGRGPYTATITQSDFRALQLDFVAGGGGALQWASPIEPRPGLLGSWAQTDFFLGDRSFLRSPEGIEADI